MYAFFGNSGVYSPSHRNGDEFMQRDEHTQYPESEQLGDDRKGMQQAEREAVEQSMPKATGVGIGVGVASAALRPADRRHRVSRTGPDITTLLISVGVGEGMKYSSRVRRARTSMVTTKLADTRFILAFLHNCQQDASPALLGALLGDAAAPQIPQRICHPQSSSSCPIVLVHLVRLRR
jgi:hypothetical protein